MKKTLKKKMKSSSKAVRYFSQELISYTVPIQFANGMAGACTYSCS